MNENEMYGYSVCAEFLFPRMHFFLCIFTRITSARKFLLLRFATEYPSLSRKRDICSEKCTDEKLNRKRMGTILTGWLTQWRGLQHHCNTLCALCCWHNVDKSSKSLGRRIVWLLARMPNYPLVNFASWLCATELPNFTKLSAIVINCQLVMQLTCSVASNDTNKPYQTNKTVWKYGTHRWHYLNEEFYQRFVSWIK